MGKVIQAAEVYHLPQEASSLGLPRESYQEKTPSSLQLNPPGREDARM